MKPLTWGPKRRALWLAAIRELYRVFQKARYKFYRPQHYQYTIHCAMEKIRALLAGNQIGKTILAINESCWDMTLDYPDWYPEENRLKAGSTIGLIVPDMQKVGEGVWLAMMREWWPDFENDNLWIKRKNNQPCISWIKYRPTGNVFEILSDSMDPGDMVGTKRNKQYSDEPFKEDKYPELMRALYSYNGRFLAIATPVRMGSWFKREFFQKSQLGRFPDGHTFCIYKLPMKENKYTTEAEIEDFLSRVPESERETRRNGTFMQESLLVFERIAENLEDFIINDFPADPEWTQYVAIDPHPSAPWAAEYAMIGPEGIPVYFDEVYRRGLMVSEFVKVLEVMEESEHHAKQPPDVKLIDWWCDTEDQMTAKSVIDLFDEAGYYDLRAYDKYPGCDDAGRELIRQRANKIEVTLQPDSWFIKAGVKKPEDAGHPVEMRGFYIMRRCRELIYSLENLTFEDRPVRTGKDPSSKEEESLAHTTDCAKMIELDYPYHQPRNKQLRQFKRRKSGQAKAKVRRVKGKKERSRHQWK